jgi:hypothetical protein
VYIYSSVDLLYSAIESSFPNDTESGVKLARTFLLWLKLSRSTGLVMHFVVHLHSSKHITNLLEEFHCLASCASTSRLHKVNCKLEEGGARLRKVSQLVQYHEESLINGCWCIEIHDSTSKFQRSSRSGPVWSPREQEDMVSLEHKFTMEHFDGNLLENLEDPKQSPFRR